MIEFVYITDFGLYYEYLQLEGGFEWASFFSKEACRDFAQSNCITRYSMTEIECIIEQLYVEEVWELGDD